MPVATIEKPSKGTHLSTARATRRSETDGAIPGLGTGTRRFLAEGSGGGFWMPSTERRTVQILESGVV